MSTASFTSPHPAAKTYVGTIHFRGAYAYFKDDADHWALLEMDSPFSGVLNFAIAAHTASRLAASYQEDDPVQLHGIVAIVTYNQQPLQILFLC